MKTVKRVYRWARISYKKEGLKGVLKYVYELFCFRIYPSLYMAYLRHRTGEDVILKDVLGYKMFIDLKNDSLGYHLIRYGIWEPGTTRMLFDFLHEGMSVIDIGANIGYFTLIEARAVGERGKVYAIEPDPRNLKLLRKNVEINNLHNVEVFNCAISDKTGTEKFYLARCSNWNTLIPSSDAFDVIDVIEVEAYSLDDFVEKNRIEKVDAIRMDIEGGEGKVIDGGISTLKKAKILIMETHPELVVELGYSMEWMIDKLKSLGFELMREIDGVCAFVRK